MEEAISELLLAYQLPWNVIHYIYYSYVFQGYLLLTLSFLDFFKFFPRIIFQMVWTFH